MYQKTKQKRDLEITTIFLQFMLDGSEMGIVIWVTFLLLEEQTIHINDFY